MSDTTTTYKTRLRPTFDRLLVERIPAETSTAGGIVIPEASTAKPNIGYVRDMGPQVDTRDTAEVKYGDIAAQIQTFSIGDKVMIGRYAGVDMDIDGHPFTLIKQDEVMGILEQVAVTSGVAGSE